MKRVLALAKYGPQAASTRQRLLIFAPALEVAGFAIDLQPLLDDDYVRTLASGAAYSKRSLVKAYIERLQRIMTATHYDLLWVYAELFPFLPGAFERLAVRAGKPIIYDFDDAFFDAQARHWWLRDKLQPLIAAAAEVSAGNEYLAAFARRWNDRVNVFPTVVDTRTYRPSEQAACDVPVIGWIGSPSTWAYVRPLLPLLNRLCLTGRARFLAVGAGTAGSTDQFAGLEHRDWSESREIADVQAMHIGIMPLPDEPWARGKCGYKLIQYMACGLPTVASPVGVNRAIVLDGQSGFLAADEREWSSALDRLIADPALRRDFGRVGRARVEVEYSLRSQASRVVSLFEQALERSPDRKG